jgi:ABC-type multidrug transport system fused ATPase/permease subunit
MGDPFQNLLAHEDLQKAQKHAHTIREIFTSEEITLQKSYETFYTNLALFSGGTIALSVTYLGYLKSTGMPIVLLAVLITSWSCLLVALALGLFYPFFYSHYRWHARMREYQQALSSQKTAESEIIGKAPIIGLTSAEFDHERARLGKKADSHASFAHDLKKKEDLYYWMFRWAGFAARLIFLAGLMGLFVFATLNALQQRGSVGISHSHGGFRSFPIA